MPQFLLQVSSARSIAATLAPRKSTSANHGFDLIADFSAIDWRQLSQLANALTPLLASTFDVPPIDVRYQEVIRGPLSGLLPSIDLIVDATERQRGALALAVIARFVDSLQAETPGGSLFVPASQDTAKFEPMIEEQRLRLLSQVGGRIVKTPMLIRADDFQPLALRGRWARVPNRHGATEERIQEITGHVDGFWHSLRRLYICDAYGRSTHSLQFDELTFLGLVQDLCAQIRPGFRPKCLFTVLRQSCSGKTALQLRDIKPQTTADDPMRKVLELELAMAPDTLEEAAMA